MRVCFLNGEFVREDQATISVFDRGFLFSDGVYEISAVMNGKLVDNVGHLARLERSLEKIGVVSPYTREEIIALQEQIIEKNHMQHGGIYIQITRGIEKDRDFLPATDTKPTFMLIPQPKNLFDNPLAERGISVMTLPEIRWAKRDIKSIGLLGAVLAKKTAHEQGYDDAWFIEDGFVTEGSANNAYIIKDKQIITKAPSEKILNGITRQTIQRFVGQRGLSFVERDFNIEEALAADEAFVSSATMLIVPVVSIDGNAIGNGNVGKITRQLRETYIEMAVSGQCP